MRFAYSMAGEGRGHTTRGLGLGQALIDRGHEVRFFTSGDSPELLRARFGDDRVIEMDIPRLHYNRRGLDLIKTAWHNAPFFLRRGSKAKAILPEVEAFRPDALICDFEPTMSAVARRLGLPLISFDCMHFVSECRLRGQLSLLDRCRIWPVALALRVMVRRPGLTVVAKPFDLPPRRSRAHLVGPVLRTSILEGGWTPSGSHIVAYLRNSTRRILPALFEVARSRGLQVRFYGWVPEHLPEGAVHRPISEEGFLHDLMTSDLVIGTSGTQLIGEVAHLGIPTILVPEPGQIEQSVNAKLAEATCPRTDHVRVRDMAPARIEAALDELPTRSFMPSVDGTQRAADLIVSHIEQHLAPEGERT